MIKENIASLLDKEVDRKDFLKLAGFGLIALTGVTQIMKALSTPSNTSTKQVSQPQAYGAMAYGGTPKKQ